MSQETLKRFRLIVPGVIILIALYLLDLPFYDSIARKLGMGVPAWSELSEDTVLYLLLVIVVVVLGGLYYAFDVRGPFLRDSLRRIRNNIRDQLLAPFEDDDTIAPAAARLRKGRTLLHIFYHFVDNDESLKQKAKRVYFNGLIWSTTADVMAVSTVSALLSLLLYIASGRTHYLGLTAVFWAIYVLSAQVILPRVTKRHIELGDNQLEFILVHYRDELRTRLEKAAAAQE